MAPNHPAPTVLVVDDEPSLREMLSIALRRAGYDVVTESGVRLATHRLRTELKPIPVVLTDLVMPDGSGHRRAHGGEGAHAATEVIVMTAHSTVESGDRGDARGAYDFVTKPFSPAEITRSPRRRSRRAPSRRERPPAAQIERARQDSGRSPRREPRHAARRRAVRKVAPTRTTVLITGESGTGKERVARALHEQSDRNGKPFLVVNCGALPEAADGERAVRPREGLVHRRGGALAGPVPRGRRRHVVLLDEVGELPLPLQVKLLRVLQERRCAPVGAERDRRRRAPPRGDEPRHRDRRAGRQIPARPLLSAQRDPRGAAAPARADGRTCPRLAERSS
jgi:two-component system response regulator PilR (NtrC family)